jgi:hypothetical protein
MKLAMDAAISKIVLSQTMTTDDGSSRSQAQVHENVADAVVKSDADLINESFMRGPLKWWTEWNFPGAQTPRLWRDIEPAEDLNLRAERDVKVKSLGFSPTEEYILEVYGEGWEETEVIDMGGGIDPVTGLPLPPKKKKPGTEDDDTKTAGFGEAEIQALDELKRARRKDQDVFATAADEFAGDYSQVIGERVTALADAAERTGNVAEFRRHIDAMFLDEPNTRTVERLANSTVFARLLGKLRGQRK